MIKTLDDLRNADVQELLQMYDQAQGTTKDFQSNFSVEFSYTTLTGEIKSRGYEQKWQKASNHIVKLSATDRLNLSMTKNCKEKYAKFLKDKTCPYIYTTAALESFMDAYNNRTIDVTFKA